MAVVEGYTDVIAAHQVGLANVVGTLGTALGDDHVHGPAAAGRPRRPGLRRRRGRPEGGRPVAGAVPGPRGGRPRPDPAREPRPLRLPARTRGPTRSARWSSGRSTRWPSRIDRAAARFDLDSLEGSRQAAEWVLGDPRPGPGRASRWGSTSRWPRRSTRSRSGSASPSRRSKRRLRRAAAAGASRAGPAAEAGARPPPDGRTPSRPAAADGRRSGRPTSTRPTAN